jgi:hypothetical protein
VRDWLAGRRAGGGSGLRFVGRHVRRGCRCSNGRRFRGFSR